jgi:putative FmdB family regulatory protein
MPLYEYECRKKKCKTKRFEKLVFGDEEDKAVRCPECKGKVKKIMSVFSHEINGFNADNGYSKKGD